MPGPVDSGTSERQAEQFGLPVGFKTASVFPFGGLNLSDSRLAIEDREFTWLENYIRLGKGRMRTSWDVGNPLYFAPSGKTIVSFYWFNIASGSYCAVFLSDGTAVQVSYPTGQVRSIGSIPGQFYQSGGPLPTCCPWGSQYLLIANNLTANSYWVWDGNLLYSSGGIAPTVDITSGGEGYTSAPLVTAFGGSGSGAAYVASIVNGSVVSVVPVSTGSGYGPSDQVQLQFSGGGTDSGAILQAVVSGGALTSLLLTNGGSGYTSTPTVTFTGGGGTGATAAVTLSAGGVASINVTAGGSGYTSAPNIVISGDGTGATAVATVAGGAITAINMTAAGSGYTMTPTVRIFGVGTGAAASAVLIGAAIQSITLTNGGSGYTGSPTVGFTGGSGSGAAAVALLTAGTVSAINVVNGGTNFIGTPTLTVTGGGGTGAAATAVVTSGVITSVDVTNGGSGYTSAPTVTVQSGINNAASATASLMPIGLSGSAMETYQSRVWLAHPFQAGTLPSGGTITLTAPGSFTDIATSDGGLIFQNSDRFLRSQYVNLRQSNGYLYALGDSSVSAINNVQTSGNPATTTFNALNVDPQTGTSWRDTTQDYARTILFGNPFGVFGIYGGAVTKVSKKLDPLFDTALFPPTAGALTPSAAVAELFAQRFYLMLMTITDPFTKKPRNVMIGWDEQDWSIFTQSAPLIYIGTQLLNSDPLAWGTDGASLMQLFLAPSNQLPKTLQTKYFAADSAFLMEGSYAIYVTAQTKTAQATTLSYSTVTLDTIGSAQSLSLPPWMQGEVPTQGGSYPMAIPIAFNLPASGNPVTFGTATDPPVAGSGIGLTMVTSVPDYELVNLQIGYIDVHAIA
jgi:hypothetical protein